MLKWVKPSTGPGLIKVTLLRSREYPRHLTRLTKAAFYVLKEQPHIKDQWRH
jgi:hypothetical protein